ncbi:MAG TPA: response regulator transcription factor [Candidatus Obscuribacterales bacterium]
MSIVVNNFGNSDQGIKASPAHFSVGGSPMTASCKPCYGKVLLVRPAGNAEDDAQSALLRNTPFEVIGQVDESIAALVSVKNSAPDIVIFDVGHFGITLAKTIAAMNENTQVLALLQPRDSESFCPLFQSGVSGFALEDIDGEHLLSGMSALLNGDLWFDARLRPLLTGFFAPMQPAANIAARQVVPQPASSPNENGTGNGSGSIRNQPLSSRELEVLRMISRGATNNDIAKHLFLSVSTVKTVISRILDKLQVEDRVQAAVYATKNNIV